MEREETEVKIEDVRRGDRLNLGGSVILVKEAVEFEQSIELIAVAEETGERTTITLDPKAEVGLVQRSDWYVIEMPDSSERAIPVTLIAMHRASHYADEFNGDLTKSIDEDTRPCFEADDYEIRDWASNNMDWEDVKEWSILVSEGNVDFGKGWINGEYRVENPEVVRGQ